jgi:hypothetical protein
MVAIVVQLLPSGSPSDVEPPQVQSPEQPGTSVNPLAQVASWPEMAVSVNPVQQARWPAPPQAAG